MHHSIILTYEVKTNFQIIDVGVIHKMHVITEGREGSNTQYHGGGWRGSPFKHETILSSICAHFFEKKH
jgi:hypothetical protein